MRSVAGVGALLLVACSTQEFSSSAVLAVSGVGPKKIAAYGDALLELLGHG